MSHLIVLRSLLLVTYDAVTVRQYIYSLGSCLLNILG